MRKRSGQGAAFWALIAAGALCVVSASAHAEVTINVIGQPCGGVVGSLSSGGASVAATQNDIVYTGAFVAHSKKCLRTKTTPCNTDADCPLSDPSNPSSAKEPCTDSPTCIVHAAGKEGFFSFLKTPGCKPPDCTCTPGTDCTALRAIIVSLNFEAPISIADGPMYTCYFNNAGTSAVPLPNSNQKASDPNGVAIAATAISGPLPPSGCACVVGQTCGPSCACVDDCDSTGEVFGNEVTKAVNIVAGNADLSTCVPADADCDGEVFGNEVTIGVNNVANGCPGA